MPKHYDTPTNLFSGLASVAALTFGLESPPSFISTNINSLATYLEVENNSVSDVTSDVSGNIFADVEGDSSTPNTSTTLKCNNKSNREDENCVPRLIDNKRWHLEKGLTQSQRHEILLSKRGRLIQNKTLSSNKGLK